MKHWLASAFLLLSIVCAHAENISGQWQGTLHASGQDRRLVVKIQDTAGKLRGLAYNLDEEPVAASCPANSRKAKRCHWICNAHQARRRG